MHLLFLAQIVLVWISASYGNPNVSLDYECALRAFTVEMAGYIAPAPFKANWTSLAQSAFQFNQCNGTNQTSDSSPSAKPFPTAPETPKGACHHTVFVHDANGNDLFDGTFEKPMKTIQAALAHTRTLRSSEPKSDSSFCITIRGGTYYLGGNATTTSSQIGVLALTSNDSNLVIENYQDEPVILSGGALLQLDWTVHGQTAAGGTVMKAQIPAWINVDQFNELYIDDWRAIVAKYPNGDPATQGLYAANPGFSPGAQSWLPPAVPGTVDITLDSPTRNNTHFSNYRLGIGGGASAFDPPASFWGSHRVPQGLTVQTGALPHLSNWSNASTGFVHTFHGSAWGGWIFEIASSDSANNTILFRRGGFQEARGSDKGGPFYVSNIFEELDSPNEWFLDKSTRTLYFMPNDTMPKTFVASQVPCLISVSGSSRENSVHNITIQGLTFTQTTNTYMRGYMVPSGGDWSVHRGATVYLTNTHTVTITRNLFTQLGSNAIALIDSNNASVISLNELVWLADSGIILVGTTNGIDGFSVCSQPANVLIQSNLIHETGIYVKQSSPVLIAVSRSVSVLGNLLFNMPRAAININDGFYGNHTLAWNVIFNTVRETGDHGPINTWDRQPYLTDARQAGTPSLWQHPSYIHHNTIVKNYHSVWPIDHDDGSCFYEDSYNFLVYGGKKNYLGHSKLDHHEIYVLADMTESQVNGMTCLTHDSLDGGYDEVWVENICTLHTITSPYRVSQCDVASPFMPHLANNTIYVPSGKNVTFICGVNGTSTSMSLEQWQALGFDLGTTIQTTPDIQTIIQWGRQMLQHVL